MSVLSFSTTIAMAAAAAAEGGGHAPAKAGLPQLDFTTWPSQIFWLCVALWVLYQLMTKLAMPQIAGTLADRADTISDDLDTAERFRAKAKAAQQGYEAALAAARAEAQKIALATRDAVQAELDVALAKAGAEIAARTAQSDQRIAEIGAESAAGIEAIATETATAIISTLLPQALDADAVRAAVQARL